MDGVDWHAENFASTLLSGEERMSKFLQNATVAAKWRHIFKTECDGKKEVAKHCSRKTGKSKNKGLTTCELLNVKLGLRWAEPPTTEGFPNTLTACSQLC